MSKIIRVIAAFLATVTYMGSGDAAYAQTFKDCGPGKVYNPDFQICIPTDAPGFASMIYSIGLGLIGFVAVIFLMIGGYYLMASKGNVEYVQRGKSYIFYSIAGLLLAILGFLLIEITTGVLQIPGFSV
jgi:hypothetical protein